MEKSYHGNPTRNQPIWEISQRSSPSSIRKAEILTGSGGHLKGHRFEPLQIVLVHLGEVQVESEHLVLLEERAQLRRPQDVRDVLPDLVCDTRLGLSAESQLSDTDGRSRIPNMKGGVKFTDAWEIRKTIQC